VNPADLRGLLDQVGAGTLSTDEAVKRLRHLPFENLGHTRVDHHRSLRNGFPEVIYGEGKTCEQVVDIARSLFAKNQTVIVTRTGEGQPDALLGIFSDAVHHSEARMVVIENSRPVQKVGHVAVLCGGTSDISVAEEASVSAEILGSHVERAFDVGIAGLPRLLAELDSIREANVIIAVAGMEGALPSVVAGLVETPVIAVPTSVGYGTSLGGLTALFAMLNSCADGLSVVNIDNGFGAGFQAHLINRMASKS
jgi:NCAIR mutase (PurE)-related protein